jgi:transposase-like protein
MALSSWYADETYLKVKGRWVYLYRAIDLDGNLVDVFLSETRDHASAEAFFRPARTVTDRVPARVTTDVHGSYPGAIKTELGEEIPHHTNRYLNNHLGAGRRRADEYPAESHNRGGVQEATQYIEQAVDRVEDVTAATPGTAETWESTGELPLAALSPTT